MRNTKNKYRRKEKKKKKIKHKFNSSIELINRNHQDRSHYIIWAKWLYFRLRSVKIISLRKSIVTILFNPTMHLDFVVF